MLATLFAWSSPNPVIVRSVQSHIRAENTLMVSSAVGVDTDNRAMMRTVAGIRRSIPSRTRFGALAEFARVLRPGGGLLDSDAAACVCP